MFNLNFEIMLTQNDGMYVAHCGNFPECQGLGITEDEALNDLADAISCRVTDSIRGVISDFLKSGVLETALKDLEKHKQSQDLSSSFSIEKQQTSAGTATRKILFSGAFPETNLAKFKKPAEGVKKFPSIFARYLPSQMGLGATYGMGIPTPEIPLFGDFADPISGFMISLN